MANGSPAGFDPAFCNQIRKFDSFHPCHLILDKHIIIHSITDMDKFIIQYQFTDECTFSCDSYRVVEAESIEEVQVEFLEQLEKAVNKNNYCFTWLDIDFKVSNYVYPHYITGQTVWDNLDVMTVEEFLNNNSYKL